ncbi:hypothetical protein D3C72_2232670 [compost metagenome]
MHFVRRQRHIAITIGTPQQQQIAQTLQTRRRACLDHGISPLVIHFNRGHHRHRIAFREAAAQAGSDQHVAHANIGIVRQVFEL